MHDEISAKPVDDGLEARGFLSTSAPEHPATDATWLAGWQYVYRNRPQYKSVGSTLVHIDNATSLIENQSQINKKAGVIALVFVLYSARIFVIPLWKLTDPYIPVVCPIYGEGTCTACRSLCAQFESLPFS
jgi:hypothetical protein